MSSRLRSIASPSDPTSSLSASRTSWESKQEHEGADKERAGDGDKNFLERALRLPRFSLAPAHRLDPSVPPNH
jgi:hypothetical protein